MRRLVVAAGIDAAVYDSTWGSSSRRGECFAGGYEIEVIIGGSARVFDPVRPVVMAAGDASLRNPGDRYRIEFLEPSTMSVAFAISRRESAWLSAATEELRFEERRVVDPHLANLATTYVTAVRRGLAVGKEELGRELCAFMRRNCRLVAPDAVGAVKRELDLHFARSLYISHLAELAGMRPVTLRRSFIDRFGMSPIRYRLYQRLAEAARLVATRVDLSIGEIATIVGFEDASFFHRAFRRQFGATPAEVRRDLAASTGGSFSPIDTASAVMLTGRDA
jgi:AraC-like DNA-binding protein